MAQAESVLQQLRQLDGVEGVTIGQADLGKGSLSCILTFPETLFYDILSAKTGLQICDDVQLFSVLTELAQAKENYDRFADAVASVQATGYGIVMPSPEEMILEKPELLRKGNAYGIKLKAGASSIHMIRVDIDTQISPIVGDEKQSQELINQLSGEDPEKLWQSNLFGKTVYELIRDGLNTKLVQIPTDVQGRFRGILTRVVNEGATGLICLIL